MGEPGLQPGLVWHKGPSPGVTLGPSHQKRIWDRGWISDPLEDPDPVCAHGSGFKEFHFMLGRLSYKTRKVDVGV